MTRRIVSALLVACAAALLADLFYDKGGHFGWERVFGFHAFYGFASYVTIVLGAKQLRRILMRDENYYGHAAEQFDNVTGDDDR